MSVSDLAIMLKTFASAAIKPVAPVASVLVGTVPPVGTARRVVPAMCSDMVRRGSGGAETVQSVSRFLLVQSSAPGSQVQEGPVVPVDSAAGSGRVLGELELLIYRGE